MDENSLVVLLLNCESLTDRAAHHLKMIESDLELYRLKESKLN